MDIFFAETVAGCVRIACEHNAVTELEFIEKNLLGTSIAIPKALQCAFNEKQLGKGSTLLPRGTEFHHRPSRNWPSDAQTALHLWRSRHPAFP